MVNHQLNTPFHQLPSSNRSRLSCGYNNIVVTPLQSNAVTHFKDLFSAGLE